MENKQEIKKAELSHSERFTSEIIKQFTDNTPSVINGLNPFQKRLCQSYFITLDNVLKNAELKRMQKSEKYRDKLPITWQNVNMPDLAINLVAFSRIGLDPAQPNHVSLIPFKNKSTNKYDVVFMPGYRGIELKAKKYGIDVPDDIIVEIVYSKDKFKQIKKSLKNDVESYDFTIEDSFDRGEIIGGFYYYSFYSTPQKNRLKVFTLKDIEKRKPKHASVEFWGGEKDTWEDGKKKDKEKIEGWFEEMCFKTIYRAAYNNITIDSEKIDDDYMQLVETIEIQDSGERIPISDKNEKMLPEPNSQELGPEPEPNKGPSF